MSYIPQATLDLINQHHPPGTRHHAMMKIAIPMIGNGLSPDAVRAQLRATFPDADKTDKEIADVVDWAIAKNPTPSGYGPKTSYTPRQPRVVVPMPKQPTTAKSAQERLSSVTGGLELGEVDLTEQSPIRPPENWKEGAATMLRALYAPTDRLNLVTNHFVVEGKAKPSGGGKTLSRDEWLKWLAEKGVPQSAAGCWIRPNPCGDGTGKDGAIRDQDITAFRFLLLESDLLPLNAQFAALMHLHLPVAAVITSGGASVHAWLKVDCKDANEYAEVAVAVFQKLEPLGYDPANKNPSRLSRFPGAMRKIGAGADPMQRLVYLNPNPVPLDLEKLEAETAPQPQDFIRGNTLGERMRIHMAPKPTPFTLPIFKGANPNEGFFIRDEEVTLWTGMSGHGKSTLLANVMIYLINAQIPMFICSLEYTVESLCEMLAKVVYARDVTASEAIHFVERLGHLFTMADITGEIEPAKLIGMMRYAHTRHGARHFFLDSLMRVAGLDEDFPAQGKFMNDMQAVAKSTKGHVHIVAHPRKFDEDLRARIMDVKGSSMLVNNADNVVAMRRNTEKRRKLEEGKIDEARHMHDAEFAVEKQRATGWLGMMKLDFNAATRSFTKHISRDPEIREHPKWSERRKSQ